MPAAAHRPRTPGSWIALNAAHRRCIVATAPNGRARHDRYDSNLGHTIQSGPTGRAASCRHHRKSGASPRSSRRKLEEDDTTYVLSEQLDTLDRVEKHLHRLSRAASGIEQPIDSIHTDIRVHPSIPLPLFAVAFTAMATIAIILFINRFLDDGSMRRIAASIASDTLPATGIPPHARAQSRAKTEECSYARSEKPGMTTSCIKLT